MNQTRLHLLLLAFLVLLWAQPGLAAPKKKAAQVHPSFYMDQGYTVLTGRPSVAIWGQMISMAECSLYEVPYSGPDEPADAEKIASHPLPVRHWTQSLSLGKKYGQKRIYLPVTRQGTYRLVIRAGPFRSQKTFRYSLLGMIVKQAPGQLLVLVEDMLKQATARDARVEVKRVYHMTRVVKKGKKTRTIRWDRTETVYRGKPGLLSLDLSGEFTVAAVRGGDFVRYREDLGAKERSFKVYVYTDRPIYRPKGVVHFRGILRELTAGRYTIPVGSVQVEVRDSQDGVLYKKTLTLTPFGSFSDHLALPEEVPLGDCSIVTTIDNKAHYQPFSVGEYRKPEFQVEVAPDRKHLTMGEDLVFRVRSSYYFGGPVSDGKVYYQIRAYTRYFDTWERSEEEAWAEEAEASHRSHGEEFVKEGEVRLSETGEALVTVPSMKHKSEKIYQIQATVTDASSRTAKGSASVDVTRGEFLLGALCDRFAYGKGETVSVKLLARDLDGKPVSTPVKIQVDLEKWAPRGSTYPNVLTGETVLNDKGEGVFAFQAPRSGYFR
ncbi:MAG: hypothetical protein HYU64_09370, partial [Armatimonadetes bacterium]|nr:hypothetical protein [Armatimonadota bacterium]